MARDKKSQQFARILFQASLEEGRLSADRVGQVLQYVENQPPRRPIAVLKAYHRLVEQEIGRTQARVEAPQALSESVLSAVAGALSRKYGRSISAEFVSNPDLIAGLRVRVADDVYEASVAGQLQALAPSFS